MDQEYACDYCEAVFPSLEDLREHLQTCKMVPLGQQADIFECAECGELFTNAPDYARHQAVCSG